MLCIAAMSVLEFVISTSYRGTKPGRLGLYPFLVAGRVPVFMIGYVIAIHDEVSTNPGYRLNEAVFYAERTDMHKRSNLRGRPSDGTPNPIDIHIGNRIRVRRGLLGLTQEKLAALLGLTFQQIQKYERGTNRISGSRLWDLAQVLKVDANFFFADMDEDTLNQSPRHLILTPEMLQKTEKEPALSSDPLFKQEAMELVQAYYQIHNRKTADLLHKLMVNLSKSNDNISPCHAES